MKTGSNRSKRREQRKKFFSPLLCCLCLLLFNCFGLSAANLLPNSSSNRSKRREQRKKFFSPLLCCLCCLCLLLFNCFGLSAANLLPNSSFECGPGRGWVRQAGSDAAGNPTAPAGALSSSTAVHGANSFRVGIGSVLSRGVWLTPGTYTLSFYGRANPATVVRTGILGGSELTTNTLPTTVTFTNGWQRFTSTRALATNGMYAVKFYQVTTNDVLIDAVQLETGIDPTAYAPQYPVELALDTADPDNLLLAGDTKQFRLRFWNEGPAITALGQYLIYDYLNRLVASNSISQALAASTNLTVAVALPARNGYLRIVSRLYGSNDSSDETSVALLPYAASSSQDTNAFLGTHPNYSPYHMLRERRSGLAFARDLSPAKAVRWSTVQPNSGAFVFNDVAVANISTNGMVPICNLYPGGSWPTWATNLDGSADFSAYTNYVFQVVARYSQAPYNVHYWETFNEPNASLWNSVGLGTNLTGIASMIEDSVKQIFDADPQAYIIAFGGMAHAADALTIWNALSPGTQSKISAVAGHIYPQDGSADPNLSESDVHFASMQDWARAFAGIRPVWNTESGGWSVGGMKTRNALREGNYSLSGLFSPETVRNEKQQRSQYNVDRCLYAALRSLGWGMRYINYWSKYYNDSMLDLGATDPTILEYNGAETPAGVALLLTKSFAGIGLGRITNSTAAMDLFCFTNALGSVVAAWNYDRTLKTVTLTNTTGIGIVDVMGNQVASNTATFTITRTPQYLVSATLSIAQLSNDLRQATVATLADTLAPAVAIDVAPSGSWDGNASPTLFKWSAVDTKVIPWTTLGPDSNLLYKWKLDAGTYTAFSQSNHVWLSSIPIGNHAFYVTAIDAAGNSAEVAYIFDPSIPLVTPPPPGPPPPGQWFASPTGLPGNTGAIGSPWDLQTALNKQTTIKPGDFLNLRDGVYTHAPQGTTIGSNEGYIFQVTLLGLSTNRITIRSYPGEHARLDGGDVPFFHAVARPTLLVGSQGVSTTIGAYIDLVDIEIFSSSTQTRLSLEPDRTGSFPQDISRSDGIYAQAPGVRIINCVIHDVTTGISSFQSTSYGHEYYGNVLFNNGWQGTPHVHGHNFYLQGPLTTVPPGLIKLVKRNYSTAAYDKGVQAYGSGTSTEGHYHFLENTWLGAGPVGHGNVLLGMRNGAVADRIVDTRFLNNFGYNADLSLYYQPDPIAYLDCLAANNYFYKTFLQVSSWKSLTFTNNYSLNSAPSVKISSLWTNDVILPWTFDRNFYWINPGNSTNAWVIETLAPMTFTTWKAKTGYDLNSIVSHTLPAVTNYVILQNNAYDINRGQVVVYNWSGGTNIVLNVVPLGWTTGEPVTIRNLQNYYGDVFNATVSAGRTINLDMRASSHSLAIPYGDTAALCPMSFPEFGAFLLQRTGASNPPPVVVTRTLTVSSSNPATGVTITMSPPDNNGASTGVTGFTRIYADGTLVSLTAPAIGPGSTTFSRWQLDGSDISLSRTVSLTISAAATLTAFYLSPPPPPVIDYRRSALRRRVL
jgi:hypothetical protein